MQYWLSSLESIESALEKRFSEFSPTSTMPVVNATCMADLNMATGKARFERF
jgi:hypothetical protein